MKTNENTTLDYDADRDTPIRDLADREVDTVSGGLWPAVLVVGIAFGAVGYAICHD